MGEDYEFIDFEIRYRIYTTCESWYSTQCPTILQTSFNHLSHNSPVYQERVETPQVAFEYFAV